LFTVGVLRRDGRIGCVGRIRSSAVFDERIPIAIVIQTLARAFRVVVAVHHALSRGADDRATDGADGGTHRAAGQTDDPARHCASSGGSASRGMGLAVTNRAVDLTIQFRIITSIHSVPPVCVAGTCRQDA
jgi:hypothetical protein